MGGIDVEGWTAAIQLKAAPEKEPVEEHSNGKGFANKTLNDPPEESQS